MNSHSGGTKSIWAQTKPLPASEPLQRGITADVCVIGAGIAGLTTAYQLARGGKKPVVIDNGPVAGGETERTTAHLASALDDGFHRLERLFGEEGTRLAIESHAEAINEIERIARVEGIECDFQRLDGYLFLAPGQSRAQLDREFEAARRAGGEAFVERVDRAPLKPFDTGPALRFPNQAQFHPLKFLSGVREAVKRMGGEIFPHTRAIEVQGGDQAYVKTAAGWTVHAGAVVVATNTPFNDRLAMHSKQAPYRTYAIGLRVSAGQTPLALYWDMDEPYHYARIQKEKLADGRERDVLIVGGEDHKTGQAADGQERFEKLERWTRERFPVEDVVYRWSGQVMEPVDSLGFIGRNPGDADNVFIVTGDSGHGITHGVIASLLITDLINGRSNPWTSIYDPSRKSLKAAGEYIKENVNVAAQFSDYAKRGEVVDTAELAPGEGAIRGRGKHKVAVYRDSEGNLHEKSAVCPHLGCVVHWNSLEKSWDCPCHGSRFDATGGVINGPAHDDLSSV